MKVLLINDVYKLGRAGDVKKVADGYGRNYLIPQGLAVLATPGALKQAEYIRDNANKQRAILNKEMEVFAKQLEGVWVAFSARASETGKLYGSVTTQMIADALTEKSGVEVNRRQVDAQPLRNLGSYEVGIRLTVDLVPTVTVIVYQEGEPLELPGEVAEEDADIDAETDTVTDVETDAEIDIETEEPAAEEVTE